MFPNLEAEMARGKITQSSIALSLGITPTTFSFKLKEFVWHKIERDEEIIQMLISVESDFWNNNVLANKMPAPDGSKAAEELLSKYYKTSDPDKMIPLVGFDEKLKRRAEITALQDKLEKEKKQIEQEVKRSC